MPREDGAIVFQFFVARNYPVSHQGSNVGRQRDVPFRQITVGLFEVALRTCDGSLQLGPRLVRGGAEATHRHMSQEPIA